MREHLIRVGAAIEEAVVNNRFDTAHEMRQDLIQAAQLGLITKQQAQDASFPPYMQIAERLNELEDSDSPDRG